MSLKTERAVNEAVTKLNDSKWDKFKRGVKKVALATASTLSIATGMFGTSQQMQAHEPDSYVTVNVHDLDAYLKGQRTTQTQQTQQQYHQIYANRDAYRRQQSANSWRPLAKEEAYIGTRKVSTPYGEQRVPMTLYDNLNLDLYEGVIYTNGEKVMYKSIAVGTTDKIMTFENAAQAAKYPGGDQAKIYVRNGGYSSGYGYGYGYGSNNEVVRTVEAAARTAESVARTVHTVIHIAQKHHR